MAATALLEQVLALDPRERAELARELLDSLGPALAWSESEGKAELLRRARRVAARGASDETWATVRAEIEPELTR